MESINLPESLLSDLYFETGFDCFTPTPTNKLKWEHLLAKREWSPRQAALLLVGVNANKFNPVDDCESLTELLDIIPNLTQRPDEWLRWFSENGYLDYAEKPLRDWFEQQAAPAQAEILADAGAVDDVEPETNPPLGKPNNNELALSGLLNEPANKDDWFEVIDEMTKEFYINNQNTMPSKVQARAALWKDSPKHGITVNGEDLKMIGVTKPLNPRSFNRRWNEYTNQIKPN
ncbi:MAG: hypothetical protein Q7U38_18735 [Methylobacter sp.]|nr:hypothetical protein [Methylobacter sp.]MDP2100456.1 hypothetical protein [Methylobacter sp.]MDP2428316.1 hypothetical protein [Methylobacter sp.]MDP3055667.1 hypothetical protein [Methylobacter sp.]MDP3361397.1 hypothetical protein [Methylobacter sp.]